jgi:hypothetical protein
MARFLLQPRAQDFFFSNETAKVAAAGGDLEFEICKGIFCFV